jgi:DNA-binding transcriptional LysR family regulator
MIQFEINYLRYFYYVARESGFTKAAQRLNVAQPVISRAINNLEAQLRVQLIDRSSKQIQLTPQGQVLFQECRLIFESLENLSAKLSHEDLNTQGDLKFSCTDVVAKEWISPTIKQFNKVHPEVHPFVFVGQGSQALEFIRDGHLDFGIFFYVPELYGDFEIKDILKVPYELVVGAKWEKDVDVINRFIGSREVDFLGAKRFPTLEKLRKKYPDAKISLSSNSLELHKDWVMQGLGVSILPRFLVEAEIKSGKLKKVLPETFEFSLKLVTKQGKVLNRRAEIFLEAFKAQLAKD